MDATQVKRELRTLHEQRERLDDALATATAERDAALAVPEPRYDINVVNDATWRIGKVERDLAQLALRIDAFERQLPSGKELKSAEKERAGLLERLTFAQDRYCEAWRGVFDALARLEPAATKLNEARDEAERLAAEIKAHDRAFGLDVDAPTSWSPSPTEAKIFYLRGVVATQLPFGAPSDTVTLDLANALSDAEPETAAS